MSQCTFQKAWSGRCQHIANSSGKCAKHDVACVSCGASATHDCDETGQFVCGAPLCNDCEHTIAPDGTNGGIGFNAMHLPDGMKQHCRKDQQVFTPWYKRERS